jgi:hypothetical protein
VQYQSKYSLIMRTSEQYYNSASGQCEFFSTIRIIDPADNLRVNNVILIEYLPWLPYRAE